jgi:hypothetical protein
MKMQGLILRDEVLIVGLKIFSFYVDFLQIMLSEENYTSEEAMKTQREGKSVAVLFHYSRR